MRPASISDDLCMSAHSQSLAFLSLPVNRTSSDILSSDSDMHAGERLRQIRQKRGLSAADLALRIGRSESAVRNQENGTNGIPTPLAEKYAKALNVSAEWLLYGNSASDERPTTETVPLVGYVSAGASLVQYSEGQGPFDQVPAPRHSTPQTVAAAIRGVSLGPAFDEAILFYDDVRSPITPDLYGRLCVVGLADGRVLVKLVRPGENGLFHLISNTAEEPMWNQEVVWAARVTDIRPR